MSKGQGELNSKLKELVKNAVPYKTLTSPMTHHFILLLPVGSSIDWSPVEIWRYISYFKLL